MKLMASASVVIVGSESRRLAATLQGMGLAGACAVANFDEARRICANGSVDACLVVQPRPIPDEETTTVEAPGRSCGVVAVLVVEAVTSHAARSARAAGYAALLPLGLPPQLFYRRVSALLQRARETRGRDGCRSLRFGTDGRRWTGAATASDRGKSRLQ